jgi:large subunit ribosomal protein L6
MWGTTAALLKNMVQGVAEGFTVPLRLNGVGYRAQLENGMLLY